MFNLLFLDIETTPNLVYSWGLHKQEISVDQVVTPSTVLCFSAKWLGKEPMSFFSSRKDGFPRMIREAHKLLDDADAVAHYNGISFDIPSLNREFLKLGMSPPAPFKQLDLYRVIEKQFRMTSGKLAFVGPYLKIGEKVKHEGFDLWTGCMKGDKESWATMEKYNRQDTRLLEPLYTKLLPWIEGHPNVGMYEPEGLDKPNCPNCGCKTLMSRGYQRFSTYTYHRFKCPKCGKWCHSRMSVKAEARPLTK